MQEQETFQDKVLAYIVCVVIGAGIGILLLYGLSN